MYYTYVLRRDNVKENNMSFMKGKLLHLIFVVTKKLADFDSFHKRFPKIQFNTVNL